MKGPVKACLFGRGGVLEKTTYWVAVRDSSGNESVRDLGSIDKEFCDGSSAGIQFAEIAVAANANVVGVGIRRGGEAVRHLCFRVDDGRDAIGGCEALREKIVKKFRVSPGMDPLEWSGQDDASEQYAKWYQARQLRR